MPKTFTKQDVKDKCPNGDLSDSYYDWTCDAIDESIDQRLVIYVE